MLLSGICICHKAKTGKAVMSQVINNCDGDDKHDLYRFIDAQESIYEQVLSELRRGQKQSHWIWYIFPQFEGLGFSSITKLYSIKSVAEAEAYLSHPVLGLRLKECTEAALVIEGKSAYDIFGFTDAMKLKSCATLFAYVSSAESVESVFQSLIDKYFQGECDPDTLRLL
jgi:uncharacterized protein (DUF1810 family)